MKTLRLYAVSYLINAIAFLVLDSIWLTQTSGPLYQPILAPLLAQQPDLVAAALFYLIYFVGMQVFTIRPTELGLSWKVVAARAALFGVVSYATYDLTNQATLSHWSSLITCLDMIWGGVVTALVTLFTRWVIGRFIAKA